MTSSNRPGSSPHSVRTNAARSASALSHPNVCQVFDFGEQAGLIYIIMEFIDGVTFDGSRPNDYLQAFPIGLKGDAVL